MKRLFFIFTLFSILVSPFFLAAAEKNDEGKKTATVQRPDYDEPGFFMRAPIPQGKSTPRSLQTVVARFHKSNGVEVDLIGAVHIGDKEYYEELNERFKRYDVLLYELVADKGTVVEKDEFVKRQNSNMLSTFQGGAAEMLHLEHQLSHIDYKAKNFVHADLSPEEFSRRFGERGDLINVLIRGILVAVKKESDAGAMNHHLHAQGRLVGSLLASDPSLPLKRNIAKLMLEEMQDGMWIIAGDGSAIITDRNAACLNVLRQELRRGHRRIGVFYGGAHLPEFAKSLENEFQFKYLGSEWITAWDLGAGR